MDHLRYTWIVLHVAYIWKIENKLFHWLLETLTIKKCYCYSAIYMHCNFRYLGHELLEYLAISKIAQVYAFCSLKFCSKELFAFSDEVRRSWCRSYFIISYCPFWNRNTKPSSCQWWMFIFLSFCSRVQQIVRQTLYRIRVWLFQAILSCPCRPSCRKTFRERSREIYHCCGPIHPWANRKRWVSHVTASVAFLCKKFFWSSASHTIISFGQVVM